MSEPREEKQGSEGTRLDPGLSACVLIGVDAYTDLDPLRAVRNNLTRLKETLTNPGIWGVPEDRCQAVPNPATQSELIGAIRKAAAAAQDTLIVYYAGHGFIDPTDGGLYLTLPGTEPGEIDGAVPYQWVHRAVRDNSGAKRRVVILDCCYSGQALEGMSVAESLQVAARMEDVEGSYVVSSSARNRLALSPRGEDCTAFTGELVRILSRGVPDGPEMLTLDAIFREVRAGLREKRRPLPEWKSQNSVGSLPFVRNQKWREPAVGSTPQPSAVPDVSARKRRRRGLAVTAAVITITAAVAAGMFWWPKEPGGPCSTKNASLLSISDNLDKAEAQSARVTGLSAIALIKEPTRAWVLADNDPGRMFKVSLGGTTHLNPSVVTTLTLRHADGTPYEKFDAEGLVVEKDSETVLVSAEKGSTIHRFSLKDGEELEKPLTVPPAWKSYPDGGRAEANRNLESLSATPDGQYLFTGLEGPLAGDSDMAGSDLLRIQRYKKSPDGTYALDKQFAYQAEAGGNLVELVAMGKDRLLTLERGYMKELGNTVRVYDVSLAAARDVTDVDSLASEPPDTFVRKPKQPVVDLAKCPAGNQLSAKQPQPNPLLENVEGMALGAQLTKGKDRGRHLLYLISDDNGRQSQVTRMYALSVRLA
jgi:hypothetical protein